MRIFHATDARLFVFRIGALASTGRTRVSTATPWTVGTGGRFV
jgi:hypothetical protein